MSSQFSKLNLPFERVVALDGNQFSPKILSAYQQESKDSWQHYATLSAGEIGCAMSWHKIWDLVASQSIKACVALEDDVHFNNNFQTTIKALSEALDEAIIIDLSGNRGLMIRERKTINSIKLIRYQTPPLNNQGAIYGKMAVQQLLKNIQNFKAPVDTLQQMVWLHGVQTWSLEIGCLSHQDTEVGGSTIALSIQKKTLSSKLKKELMRPLWRGSIILRNCIHAIMEK